MKRPGRPGERKVMSMQIYLVIQELGGSSANRRYPGAIDVESFTFGTRQRALALSRGLDDFVETTPSAGDITIKKSRDAISERILSAVMSGRVFSKAALIAESQSAQSVLTMIMSSVQIDSVSTEGGASNKEIVTLNFQNIHISQTLRSPA